jgi:hypothetical protein
MVRVVGYYTRFQGVRNRLTGLPAWARFLLFLASLPGILLIALSILAFLVSLLALLLLTVPLFRILSALCGVRPGGVVQSGVGGFGPPPEGMEAVVDQAATAEPPVSVVESPQEGQPRRARRQIDVKIVE